MKKNPKSNGRQSKVLDENRCCDCLYFQPPAAGRRPLQGNCTHHKEWIENATLTTCSEMSLKKLEENGIYCLQPTADNVWEYVHRTQRLRTRLFLVKPQGKKRGAGE